MVSKDWLIIKIVDSSIVGVLINFNNSIIVVLSALFAGSMVSLVCRVVRVVFVFWNMNGRLEDCLYDVGKRRFAYVSVALFVEPLLNWL